MTMTKRVRESLVWRGQPALQKFYKATARPAITFDGWFMSTRHHVPWADAGETSFRAAAQAVRDFDLSEKANRGQIDGLLWRHYNVTWAMRHALCRNAAFAAVECGVADGKTATFALAEAAGRVQFHLYDAWAAMTDAHLSEAEKIMVGRYDSLSLDRTRRNLQRYEDHTIFHRGVVPDTLEDESAPEEVGYMHIDLNSAGPTRAALDFFLPRLLPGAVVVFDDYGWADFPETQTTVYEWAQSAGGCLLTMPTGQALYFHERRSILP